MDAPPPVVKRPRGRPPKVKRGRKPNAPPLPGNAQITAAQEGPSLSENSNSEISRVRSLLEDEAARPTGSKRPSSDGDNEYAPLAKRARADSSTSKSNLMSDSFVAKPASASSSTSERKPKSTILPARRSARHTTIQATQISEGTLRPPGPPCLEAALNIALRNLESEMWRYLWSYYKKHPAGPLPTPAAVKEACPRVRTAAEAVDKADRELEDAIDEIMRSNSKKKRRGGKQLEDSPQASPGPGKQSDAGIEDPKSGSMWKQEHDPNVFVAEDRIATTSPSLPAPDADSEGTEPSEERSVTPDDTAKGQDDESPCSQTPSSRASEDASETS